MGALSAFTVDTHAYTTRLDAAACAEHLAARGAVSVEFLLAPGHLWPAELDTGARRVLARRLSGAGIAVHALNIPNFDVNLGSDYPEMRAYTVALLQDAVRLAGDLGAVDFAIGPGRSSPLFPASRTLLLGRLRAALDVLVPLGKAQGVTIAVENVPYSFLPKVTDLLGVLDDYGNGVGFTWDLANSHFVGEALTETLARCRERLRLIHISDTTRTTHRHDPVGAGDVPFASVAGMLGEIGAARVLEVISDNPDHDIPASAAALAAMGWRHA